MSSNSTGTYRDTTVADYLNDVRREQAANKFGKTGDSALVPNSIIPESDEVEISDDLSRDGDTHTFNDEIQVEDTVEEPVLFDTGMFQITDDSGGGAGVTQPGIIEFSDCG